MSEKSRPDQETLITASVGGMNTVWERMLHLARPRVYPKGCPLLLAGEALTDFYYLARGKLRIIHGAESGRERSMLYIGGGNLFNEASALAGFDNPDSQMICLEESEIWRFKGGLLHDPAFVRAHPELVINLMISLSTKTLTMHASLSNTGNSSSLAQVSRFLLGLSRAHGNSRNFKPGMTQQELATLLGLHRATLVRTINHLKNAGVIAGFTKNSLRISDLEALRRLAAR